MTRSHSSEFAEALQLPQPITPKDYAGKRGTRPQACTVRDDTHTRLL